MSEEQNQRGLQRCASITMITQYSGNLGKPARHVVDACRQLIHACLVFVRLEHRRCTLSVEVAHVAEPDDEGVLVQRAMDVEPPVVRQVNATLPRARRVHSSSEERAQADESAREWIAVTRAAPAGSALHVRIFLRWRRRRVDGLMLW